MLGRWLERLTPQQEDRLLTTKLVPFTTFDGKDAGCLVGTAIGCVEAGNRFYRATYKNPLWSHVDSVELYLPHHCPAERFNRLCQRLVGVPYSRQVDYDQGGGEHLSKKMRRGGARAADLIRTRILKNRARRALQGAPLAEAVA